LSGPGINGSGTPFTLGLADGQDLELQAQPRAADILSVDPSADEVKVDAKAKGGMLHGSNGKVFPISPGATTFCTKAGGCDCPSGGGQLPELGGGPIAIGVNAEEGDANTVQLAGAKFDPHDCPKSGGGGPPPPRSSVIVKRFTPGTGFSILATFPLQA